MSPGHTATHGNVRECDAHHVHGWATGGTTDICNGALLCAVLNLSKGWVHHREVDLGRRRITRNRAPDGPYWTVEDLPRHQGVRSTTLRR